MFKKLEDLEAQHRKITQELQRPGVTENQSEFKKMMKDLASLDLVVQKYSIYKKTAEEISGNLEILAKEKEEELRSMAKEELPSLENKKLRLEEELKILLLPKDPNDEKNVILEIRSGAGGDEACLFAEELFRGYTHYASKMGWTMNMLSVSEGNAGGVKEIIAEISGDRVYSRLKYESGVHRVQRVPKTESQGRVHTSTITVAVVPEAEAVDVQVNQNDLRIDVYRSSGNGGQSVNTTDSAVRVTHVPSGLVVTCQDGKSQLSNKEQALKVLYSRLLAIEEEKKMKEASDTRLSQIGTGDRSERIRTYNFPQSRITDHRIGLTSHALGEVMAGGFEMLIEPLNLHFQTEALKNQAASN